MGIFGVPLAFDAGTLLFPISYIFGDILTEVYGYQRSRQVIWAGFFSLVLAALFFYIISILPGKTTWQEYAGDDALQQFWAASAVAGL